MAASAPWHIFLLLDGLGPAEAQTNRDAGSGSTSGRMDLNAEPTRAVAVAAVAFALRICATLQTPPLSWIPSSDNEWQLVSGITQMLNNPSVMSVRSPAPDVGKVVKKMAAVMGDKPALVVLGKAVHADHPLWAAVTSVPDVHIVCPCACGAKGARIMCCPPRQLGYEVMQAACRSLALREVQVAVDVASHISAYVKWPAAGSQQQAEPLVLKMVNASGTAGPGALSAVSPLAWVDSLARQQAELRLAEYATFSLASAAGAQEGVTASFCIFVARIDGVKQYRLGTLWPVVAGGSKPSKASSHSSVVYCTLTASKVLGTVTAKLKGPAHAIDEAPSALTEPWHATPWAVSAGGGSSVRPAVPAAAAAVVQQLRNHALSQSVSSVVSMADVVSAGDEPQFSSRGRQIRKRVDLSQLHGDDDGDADSDDEFIPASAADRPVPATKDLKQQKQKLAGRVQAEVAKALAQFGKGREADRSALINIVNLVRNALLSSLTVSTGLALGVPAVPSQCWPRPATEPSLLSDAVPVNVYADQLWAEFREFIAVQCADKEWLANVLVHLIAVSGEPGLASGSSTAEASAASGKRSRHEKGHAEPAKARRL